MKDPPMLTRRRLFQASVGIGSAAVLSACAEVPELPFPDVRRPGVRRLSPRDCVPKSSMETLSAIGSATTVYEVSEQAAPILALPAFARQLEAWMSEWNETTTYQQASQVWNYGAWVPTGDDCDSWHKAGRAFDISRLRTANDTIVSCRRDLWKDLDADSVERLRRRYWVLAASLHRRFSYVLTYLYDDAHQDHIHIDNSQNEAEPTVFNPGSRVQVQAASAIAKYVWGWQVDVSDSWRSVQGPIEEQLEQVGLGSRLTDQSTWQAWLAASVKRG